jgi:hypothetical protein
MTFSYCSATERKIAKALVRRALKMGYSITVHDGEEVVALKTSQDEKAIFAAMNSTDSDTLIFFVGDRRVGHAWLVYGNEDYLISDWSDNAEIDAIVNFQG